MYARSLVLWVGDHTGSILEQPGRDVVGSIAMRLPNAARNTSALRSARRKLGLGVALDAETWRNQCRADHVLRGTSFRTLGYDVRDLFGVERLDIDRRLSESQIEGYAAAHLDAQLGFDPTTLQTPAHISLTTTALQNDIALAEATLEIVGRRALREPADGDPHHRRRSVFATICVRSGDLTPERIREIVGSYVRLPVDGYWVWAIGFEPSGIRAELMLRLVLALQENSGRPACPGGLSHLWQAALARGAAGAITGPDRGSVPFEPEQAPPPPRDPDEEAEEDGRLIHTYHGAVLGSFAFDKPGVAALEATFRRNGCGCGHHDAGTPPRGRKQITAHNQWWRLREARGVCRGSAAQASAELALRLPGVRTERIEVGLKSGLAHGWQRAVEEWDQASVGWGAAEGRAA